MGVSKSQTQLNDFTFTFHFHVLDREMATHSSVLAWRIPGMGGEYNIVAESLNFGSLKSSSDHLVLLYVFMRAIQASATSCQSRDGPILILFLSLGLPAHSFQLTSPTPCSPALLPAPTPAFAIRLCMADMAGKARGKCPQWAEVQ